MKQLKTYEILLSMTVRGEDEEDAVDYAYRAIDMSNIIDEDGIVGIQVLEDTVSENFYDEDDTEIEESEED